MAFAKMLFTYCSLLAAFFLHSSISQGQNFSFAKGIQNSSGLFGTVESKSIKVDVNGNTYVTGTFTGTGDFDPGTGVANLVSSGGTDIFIARYDALGNYVYAKAVGGIGADNSQGIVIDGMGNVYITGYFSGTADFDPGPGIVNLTSAGGNDIFIAKLDVSGNYIFAKSIGGSLTDMGNGIVIDVFGNICLTGYFNGTVDFDPGAGTAELVSAGASDVFIVKYDALGNYIFAKGIGGTKTDIGTGIAVDGSGSIYITGYFSGTIDFDPGLNVQNRTSYQNSIDIFIARYDESGIYIYANAIGGAASDQGNAIAVDVSGNAYVTGTFLNTVDFDSRTGTANLVSLGGNDIFIAAYDASGNYIYAKGFGGSNTDIGNSIVLDGTGNVYVTGYFFYMVDFDPGTGISNLTSNGSGDVFVAKYDVAGNYVFSKGLGGANEDSGNSIGVDGLGNLYTTGYFSGIADFNPGDDIANLTIGGVGHNAFIMHLVIMCM